MLGVVAMVALGMTVLPASPAGGQVDRLKVCDQSRPGYEAEIDAGEAGESPGDYVLFTDKLLDPRTGRKAGRDVGKFFFVRPVPGAGGFDAVFTVDATFFFPGGKIIVYSAGKFGDFRGDGVDFPVAGGTGKYENVGGSVNIRSGQCDGKGGTVFRFHIQKP